ncbi:hypothetical protein QBC36DRAFT_315889 [Triangularia setosa]|uniref:Uncharacterized protein n=1 Tax=Triangularia setosa TaxID=2587417 RepID=A0AAN6VZD1_9PEZI|nr:hypothetical protein QBC36DRAFT_315889 [Podospora setosa]
MPDIKDVLRNIDIGYANIFVRLYIIGKRQETSMPMLMICSNPDARALVEGAIRGSSPPAKFPEFGLGASALPWEQHGPARTLAGEEQPAAIELVDAQPFWCATGGAVVRIGDSNFQITAGHVKDHNWDKSSPSNTALTLDLDECHFDRMSDDEDTVDESAETELDATLARASLTPAADSYHSGIGSARSDSSKDSGIEDITIRSFSPAPMLETTWKLKPAPSKTVYPADIKYFEEALDFALIGFSDSEAVSCLANTVYFSQDSEIRVPHPRLCTDFGKGISRVIAITSRCLSSGTLAPGLHVLHLTTLIEAGDSGSAVIGQTSGQLYGHIFTGCPGSLLAYIIVATEIFEHLRGKTGHDVSLLGAIYPTEEPLKDIQRELDGKSERLEGQEYYTQLA